MAKNDTRFCQIAPEYPYSADRGAHRAMRAIGGGKGPPITRRPTGRYAPELPKTAAV